MAHRLAPESEADLVEIWNYIAAESGNADIADRLIDLLTDCFLLLSSHPYLGRRRDQDSRPGRCSFVV